MLLWMFLFSFSSFPSFALLLRLLSSFRFDFGIYIHLCMHGIWEFVFIFAIILLLYVFGFVFDVCLCLYQFLLLGGLYLSQHDVHTAVQSGLSYYDNNDTHSDTTCTCPLQSLSISAVPYRNIAKCSNI